MRSVVAEHYKKAGVDTTKAARYLDKVFQVDLRIPPSEAAMPRYMETQITALNDATDRYWHTIMELSGHRQTLESVLIALARNNPREVKRLLNSALLRGRAASLDITLTEGHATPEAEALRFAQGVQVFLLQRLLADRLLQSEDLLTYSHHLRWFAEASMLLLAALNAGEFNWEEFQKKFPDFHQMAREAAVVRMDVTLGLSTSAKSVSKEGQQACAALYDHLTSSPPKADPALWTSELFLRLLQVPFSVAVAAHFPPAPAVERKSALRPLKLSSLPDFLRERLAAAADVPVNDLKPEHLAQLTTLDLEDSPVTADQLRTLAAALPLEELALNDCTGLTDTAALAGFKKLRTLDLSLCTGLQGASAFQGLTGLEALEVLYLIGCSGLSNTTALAGLKKLKDLYLSHCNGLQGPEALQGLSELESLKKLDLSYCNGLDEAAVRQVRERLPAGCRLIGLDEEDVKP